MGEKEVNERREWGKVGNKTRKRTSAESYEAYNKHLV
jgi:hypothetical protein